MGAITQGIRRLLNPVGVEPRTVYLSLKALPSFWRNYRTIRAQLAREAPAQAGSSARFEIDRITPYLADRFDKSGVASGHYFHQDLLVARLIYEAKPRRHVDVGSRVDGFVAHVAVFREIEIFDIRPLVSRAPNLVFRQADMSDEKFTPPGLSDSASCLHTLEHFGLGRYGDPVDANAYLRGWANLHKLLEPGGTLYFSTPIGTQRIEFDGQRVFSVKYLRDGMIRPWYDIARMWYVDDRGELHGPVSPDGPEADRNFGGEHGCGIFELKKRA
jgi:hypothetical protein